jgi:DNA-directed RNA polymerase subunit M/transcription elongation factor TFIIS
MKDKRKKEDKEKERQKKIAMREEIKKLKEILYGRLGIKSCMVEIFRLNWNTMTWRMIKRTSVRTYLKLLDIVMNYISTTEDRYRIEFTPLYQLYSYEKEKEDNNIEESKGTVKVGDIEEDKIDTEYEKIKCPRCGGNIKKWSIVYIIKTRSGDKKLRYRCTDCNETYSDEDLGIINN